MTIPFMLASLVVLPKSLSFLVLIGLVVVGIMEFRQGHIGRVGIFANSLLLWQIFYNSFVFLPLWFQWYLNVGTILGLIALGSYLIKVRLPKAFYQVTFIGYGSLSLLMIMMVWLGGWGAQSGQEVLNATNDSLNGSVR